MAEIVWNERGETSLELLVERELLRLSTSKGITCCFDQKFMWQMNPDNSMTRDPQGRITNTYGYCEFGDIEDPGAWTLFVYINDEMVGFRLTPHH